MATRKNTTPDVVAATPAKTPAVKTASVKTVAVKAAPAKKPVPAAPTQPVAVKKVAAKKPAVKKEVPQEAAATSAPSAPQISAQQRQHYVEVAAFYIAERRGFAPGNPAEDWRAAEEEIARLIATGHMSHG